MNTIRGQARRYPWTVSIPRISVVDAVCLMLLLIVMSVEFFAATLGGLAGASDHLIIFGTLSLVVGERLGRGKLSVPAGTMVVAVAAIFALSLAGSFTTSLSTSLISTVLVAKIFYVLVVAKEVNPSVIPKAFFALLVYQIVGTIVNMAMPDYFETLRPGYEWVEKTRLMGFQLNANRFGMLSAVLAVYAYFIRRNWLVFLWMVVLILLSASRSSALILILLFVYLSFMSSSIKVLVSIVVAALLAGAAGFYLLDSIIATLGQVSIGLSGDGRYVRAIMMISGARLAFDFFPFGVGGGLFGSPLSVGSPVYAYLGIATVPTIADGSGIHDSGVGSILGEYGVLGFLIIFLLLGMAIKGALGGLIRRRDVWFLVFMAIVMSFFRAAISSYYYALIMVLIGAVIFSYRQILQRPRKLAE